MSRGKVQTHLLTHSLEQSFTHPFLIASSAEIVYAGVGLFWPVTIDFVYFWMNMADFGLLW